MDRERSKASTADPHPDQLLRGALRELADAARWASTRPDPLLAIQGYSWFNAVRHDFYKIVPIEVLEDVDPQVRIAVSIITGIPVDEVVVVGPDE